jgi:hypothetical protein
VSDPNYEAPVSDGGSDQGVTPSSPSGTGTPPTSPTPPTSASAGASGPPNNNGEWIPRTRLNEVTDRARQIISQLQYELQTARTPKPPAEEPDQESEQIKAQFFKLFPQAQKLFQLPPDHLEALIGAAPGFQAQTEHYWTTVGHHYLRQLEQSMHKVYGGQPDVKARRWIESAFIDWVQNDDQAKARYINQDPNLVAEFWQSVESLMLEPVRRSAIANEQRRADRRSRLPIPGVGTQALGKGPQKPPKDEDELHERAFEAFEEANR